MYKYIDICMYTYTYILIAHLVTPYTVTSYIGVCARVSLCVYVRACACVCVSVCLCVYVTQLCTSYAWTLTASKSIPRRVFCNTRMWACMHCTARHCNTLQYTASNCISRRVHSNERARDCSTLQHTPTHSNTP